MDAPQVSVLATVTLTWAAIYGYVAFYCYTAHTDARAESELRPFATASLGMMVYAIGEAVLVDAATSAGAVLGVRLAISGAWVAVAGFMHFAHALTERPVGRLVWGTYAAALAGLIATLSGWTLDPTLPAVVREMWIEGAHPPRLPALTLTFDAVAFPALALVLVAAWIMRARPREAQGNPWMSVAAVVLGVAGVHDTFINFVPVRSVYMLEHCYLLCALAMTHHLLGRASRADQELQRRKQELRESLTSLERTELELAHKEQLAAVGELSAIIAMEVRAPISAMRDALRELGRDTEGEARMRLLTTVDQASDRLNHLVGDLLSYAKPLYAQSVRIPVADLLHRALAAVPPETLERLDTRQTFAPDAEWIECDPELLHQALRNLLDNALAAIDGAGSMQFSTLSCQHRGGAAVQLSISATPGLTAARSGALDRAAFQASLPAGTGLGLAIVDRVVRVHQGHLEIRGGVAGGTTMVLTLPVHSRASAPMADPLPVAVRPPAVVSVSSA